jgi:hypothetical protein
MMAKRTKNIFAMGFPLCR